MHIDTIARICEQVGEDCTFSSAAKLADRRRQSLQLHLGQVIWACTQLREDLDLPNERWFALLRTAAEYMASAQVTAGELRAIHRELGRLACDLEIDPETGERYGDEDVCRPCTAGNTTQMCESEGT